MLFTNPNPYMHRYVLHITYSGYTCRHAIHAYARRIPSTMPAGIFFKKKTETLGNPIPAKSPQASHPELEKKRSEHEFTSEQNGPTPQ